MQFTGVIQLMRNSRQIVAMLKKRKYEKLKKLKNL